MSNPKLALIPSGYIGGSSPKVYSILPNDGSGDFTFDRDLNSATRVRKDGLIETVAADTPRLDWSNGNCPNLLLEAQSQNLLPKSETLTSTGNASTAWASATFGTGTISTESGHIAPDGKLSAYKFTIAGVASGNNGAIHVSDDYLGTRFNDAGNYSLSVYLKGEVGGEIVRIDFRSRTSAGVDGADFTLTKQWKRYTVTVNKSSSSNTTGGFQFRFYNRTDISNQVFYAFGCQAELANLTTSYIKSDSNTIVTRNTDKCLGAVSTSLYDITQGTYFVDVKPFATSAFYNISLSNNAATNRISWQFQNNNTQVKVRIVAGGSEINQNNETVNFGQRNKMCVTFKKDEFKIYINGSLVRTITSGDIPTGLDRVNFSVYNGSANYFEGEINDVRVYDTLLTQAEAIELTT